MSENCIREGPVPRRAVLDLLSAVDACAGRPVGAVSLVDVDVAAVEARKFKLDVSFALDLDGRATARFSVNDKGEEVPFRARLRGAADALGLDTKALEAQLALSPPAEVQTTFSVKWGASGEAPERVSIYFEELARSPRGEAVRAATCALAGASPPPLPEGAEPVAVCLEHSAGALAQLKDYVMITERTGEDAPALPSIFDEYRRRFQFHPINETRRFLIATRHAIGGAPLGAKMLWMSEVRRPELAEEAWAAVDRLRSGLELPQSSVAAALDALRSSWAHAPDTFLYPDLVSLDITPAGVPRGLVVYVSLR